MARIRAVLFDIDGTLLESNDAHAHAWVEALRGHGVEVGLERVRSKIGMGGAKLLAEIAHIDHDSPQGRTVSRQRASLLRAQLPELGPFHGARMLVDLLRSRGLVCAAVFSASAADMSDLLHAAGVADLMDEVIGADHADEDVVQSALDYLGLEADEAVMLGDTPYDIEAASRAGVATIALRCGGHWTDEDLRGAVRIYDDPADLAANLDRSPLALDRQSLPPPSPMKIRVRRLAETA